MKIVLVNYRYFFSGGPERYMFNIKELLEKEGHEVIPFSVKHNKNVDTPYEKYFLSPIGSGEAIYFSDEKKEKKSISELWKGFSRVVYSFEAKRCFTRLLKDVQPDLIYILCFQTKISCSIVDAAYDMKIPVVQRISDFTLVSPCAQYYRMNDNKICELCIKKSKWYALKYKCVYDSIVYSSVKVLALEVQKWVGLRKKVKRFIFPSSFTMQKFIEAGFDSRKLVHIPTLFNDNILRHDLEIEYRPFALYIGRTDPDKGMMTLLDAFVDTNYALKIIGFSSVEGYYEKLQKHIEGKKHHIEFLGKMPFDQMQEILSKCLFTVIPSEWYDNLPNTILESYALQKCIVATDVGSLTENVLDHQTGLLFQYKDVIGLRCQVDYLFSHPDEAKKYGRQGRHLIDTKYSDENHLKTLLGVFREVL